MSYWCHECLRGFPAATAAATASQQQPSLNCPNCGGDFIEWSNEPLIVPPGGGFSSDEDDFSEDYYEDNSQIQNNHPGRNSYPPQNPGNGGGNGFYHHHYSFVSPPRRMMEAATAAPMDYTDLARWFLSMGMGRSGRGGGPQVVGNLADYGIGQSLDDILNMSFEQDQSSGPPPASKRELSRLKKIKINKEQIASNLECTVCTEKYRINELCHLLPCKHFFHQDCIKPWLQLHNTCPVCRYELKTDDVEYEATKKKNKFTITTPPPTTTPQVNVSSEEEGAPLTTMTTTASSLIPEEEEEVVEDDAGGDILTTTIMPSMPAPAQPKVNHVRIHRGKPIPQSHLHHRSQLPRSVPRKKKRPPINNKKITPKK